MLFAEERPRIDISAQAAVSSVVLAVLAANGLGHKPQGAAPVRPPETLEELHGIPAVRCLLAALDKGTRGGTSPATAALERALKDPRLAENKRYLDTAGFQLLVWIRHYASHVRFPLADLPRSGLTAAVAEEAVRQLSRRLWHGTGRGLRGPRHADIADPEAQGCGRSCRQQCGGTGGWGWHVTGAEFFQFFMHVIFKDLPSPRKQPHLAYVNSPRSLLGMTQQYSAVALWLSASVPVDR